jgi:hypothetical protein
MPNFARFQRLKASTLPCRAVGGSTEQAGTGPVFEAFGEVRCSSRCAADESGERSPVAGGRVGLAQLGFDNAKRRRDVAGLHVGFREHGQCVLVFVVTMRG